MAKSLIIADHTLCALGGCLNHNCFSYYQGLYSQCSKDEDVGASCVSKYSCVSVVNVELDLSRTLTGGLLGQVFSE